MTSMSRSFSAWSLVGSAGTSESRCRRKKVPATTTAASAAHATEEGRGGPTGRSRCSAEGGHHAAHQLETASIQRMRLPRVYSPPAEACQAEPAAKSATARIGRRAPDERDARARSAAAPAIALRRHGQRDDVRPPRGLVDGRGRLEHTDDIARHLEQRDKAPVTVHLNDDDRPRTLERARHAFENRALVALDIDLHD